MTRRHVLLALVVTVLAVGCFAPWVGPWYEEVAYDPLTFVGREHVLSSSVREVMYFRAISKKKHTWLPGPDCLEMTIALVEEVSGGTCKHALLDQELGDDSFVDFGSLDFFYVTDEFEMDMYDKSSDLEKKIAQHLWKSKGIRIKVPEETVAP